MRSRTWNSARWGGWLAAALLWGCADDRSNERPTDPPAVVVRTDAASAAQCPSGGSVVSSGPDNNGNGLLDDIEVATRTVVCMSAPAVPPGVVIRLVAEAPGGNCAAGGTGVQSGPDANGNGKLDDNEVTRTEYACGQLLITRIAAEPEGANCTGGGVAFLAGRDRDANHMLDPGEIEITEYDCGDALSRDVDLESADDVSALANIRTISGNVRLGFRDFDVVALPHLEHVGGALTIFPRHANQVLLPVLRDVDGALTVQGDIAAADFGRLVRIGAFNMGVGGLRDLSALSSLTEIDRDVDIEEAFDLTTLDLSNLTVGGDIEISSNRRLTSVTIAARDHLGSVTIGGNDVLEMVSLSVAPSREAIATMDFIHVFTNPKLARLALAADRAGSVSIGHCPAIADVAFNVARFDLDVLVFDITAPFKLALSAPRGAAQIEFGGELTVSSALETLTSTVPVIVDGLLVFDKTLLQSLDAGARIVSARGGVRFSDNALLTDIAPFTIGGGLQLINNAMLASVPLLPVIDPGDFDGAVITDNPLLTSVPSLAQVERVRLGIDIARNPQLAQLPFPALHWIGLDLNVTDSPRLTSLALPVLEHVAGLAIESNPALEIVEAPALIDAHEQLFIRQNVKLSHLVLDALTSSFLVVVSGNPKLPTCEVLDIFSHVTGLCLQSGNDDTATCGG